MKLAEEIVCALNQRTPVSHRKLRDKFADKFAALGLSNYDFSLFVQELERAHYIRSKKMLPQDQMWNSHIVTKGYQLTSTGAKLKANLQMERAQQLTRHHVAIPN